MSGHKDKTFTERLSNAAHAKKVLLEKFRGRPAADDPAVIARQEERQAISDARDARRAEREDARRAQEAQRAAEREAQDAAERQRQAREAVEAQERAAALEIERKAARDARYAARKARK